MKLLTFGGIAFVVSLAVALSTPRFALEKTGVPGLYLRTADINLGPVDPATGADAAFEFFNYGTVPLKIDSAETDCACTVPERAQAIIAPGAKHDFGLTLKSNSHFRNRNGKPVSFQHRCIVQISTTSELPARYNSGVVLLRISGYFPISTEISAVPGKI